MAIVWMCLVCAAACCHCSFIALNATSQSTENIGVLHEVMNAETVQLKRKKETG